MWNYEDVAGINNLWKADSSKIRNHFSKRLYEIQGKIIKSIDFF